MTIMQGLKKIKHLDRKIEKNRKRIAKWCSYFSDEQPLFDTGGIKKLLQATDDMVHERNRIRHSLHNTNMATIVEVKGHAMTMDELIIMRTLTIPAKIETLKQMRRKEKSHYQAKEVTVVTQYDHHARDKAIDGMENDLDELDELLDNMNVTTELV